MSPDLRAYLLAHLSQERKHLDGFLALGNEVERAKMLDGWIKELSKVSPAPRQEPMTEAQLDEAARDAQIDFCMDRAPSFEVAFARRIEAAHGFGAQQDGKESGNG